MRNLSEQTDPKKTELELALAYGETVDDLELLTIILGKYLDIAKAKELASILINQFDELTLILDAGLEELAQIKGMSRRLAIELKQLRNLLRALSVSSIKNIPIIDNNLALTNFCQSIFCNKKQEEFHALYLSKSFELFHHAILQIGTVDHVTVYPRELLKTALKHSASHIVLIHNHPFGAANPSKADIHMTEMLMTLAKALGIGIADHLIIAQNSSFSFRKNGMLQTSRSNRNENVPDLPTPQSVEKGKNPIELSH